MMVQLYITAMTFLGIAVILIGIASGICFYAYTRKGKRNKKLLQIGIWLLLAFLVFGYGFFRASTAKQDMEQFIEDVRS